MTPRKPKVEPNDVATDVVGPNLMAAAATIDALRAAGRIEPVDTARVTAFLSMAARLDESSGDAAMWAQYRLAESVLREVHDDDTDEFSELVAAMSASVGDEADAKSKDPRPRTRRSG